MGLQNRELSMVGLGVVGDVPATPLQDEVRDGVHLRWAFEQARGFPWFGYYLFWRPSSEQGKAFCVSRGLKPYAPGPTGVDTIALRAGTLTSDRPFVVTDDFSPFGPRELDLRNRQHIRFETAPSEPVRRVEVTIGFRSGPGTPGLTCVDLRDETPGDVGSPLERDGVGFAAFDPHGAPVPVERIVERQGLVGWDPSFHGQISLPCPAELVSIELVHSAVAPKLAARDSDGAVVDTAAMTGTGPETVALKGKSIVAVEIDAPSDEAAVLRGCWRCDGDDGGDGGLVTIPITAGRLGTTVATAAVTGAPGDRRTATLAADAIDRVEVGGAAAALIDVCVHPVRDGLADGWERLDGFSYPLSLPVAHGDYPCPGAPQDPATAEALALGRVVYGPAAPWGGNAFDALHAQLERLVEHGPPPAGPSMHERSASAAGTPGAGGAVKQPRQRPLDLLLLGSLQPPLAQMLGLYWWDGTADPGVAYDYLLLADHDGSLGGDPEFALKWLANVADFTAVDGWICFGLVAEPAPAVDAPPDVRVYALPGATVTPDDGGPVVDASNSAGLVWDRRQAAGPSGLVAGAPVLFHVWRAALGDVAAPPDPADGDFDPLTKEAPLPVTRPRAVPPQAPRHPADWPPIGLHHVDRPGPDGWYAYRVSAVDLFGRHSPLGGSAAWWQWTPPPQPRPWYYTDPPADGIVHPERVRLLDKIPPPAPAGIEAVALDPADPTVTRDAAWQTWWDSLDAAERTSTIGLRVRWHWTAEQQRQAPDTREFRIYYHPGPVNTVGGRVVSVTPAGPGASDVVTDVTNVQPADAFAGLAVRIGAESFPVLASEAGSPLRLRVRNVGPARDIRPSSTSTTRCSLGLPPGHALYEDFGDAAAWHDRLLTVAYGDHVVGVGGAGTGSPQERVYEVFLPVARSARRTGLPLTTPLDEPMAFGAVGVTAADGRAHTLDHRGDPARFGNESSVGGPATVFRVRRRLPVAPPAAADSPTLFASPADYHGRSYFTYRWLPAARLRTLVYRALDDAVFQADLARRPRPALDADDLEVFPAEGREPRWNEAKRQQVAAELNSLNTLTRPDPEHPTDPESVAAKAAARAAYRGLSNDALRVLAGLPGTERVFVQLTPQPLDPAEPDAGAPDGLRWRRAGPDAAAATLPAGERAFVDALDGRAANRYFYRCAYVDEVQNVGPLGISSPAVALPDVTPPVAPRIAKLAAGERAITIEWASNREPDLAEYRVYRTFDRRAAEDVRLMDLVHTVTVAPGDPAARPRTVAWTDTPVAGLRDIWYRVVGVDRVHADPRGGGGNISAPSPAMRGRAYDATPPEPPELTVEWVRVDANGASHAWEVAEPAQPWEPAVAVSWAPAGDDVRLLVQSMGASDEAFARVSPWLAPGTTGFLHRTTRRFESRRYRLKVVSGAGNANEIFHTATLPPPA